MIGRLYGPLIFIGLLLLCTNARAVIDITATSVGTTYIVWTWTPGLDLTNMFIDGTEMCGYETTDNTYELSDLNPSEPHTLTIRTDSDSGTITTTTKSASGTEGGKMFTSENGVIAETPIPWYIPAISISVVILAVGKRRKN
jgi:hypothetical protein